MSNEDENERFKKAIFKPLTEFTEWLDLSSRTDTSVDRLRRAYLKWLKSAPDAQPTSVSDVEFTLSKRGRAYALD